ncbi:MAG: response regulator [Hyphomicrobiales bacterium]
MSEQTIKVLIVDSHPIVREGLKVCLEKTGACHVVAEAGDGYAAVLAAKTHAPDVVLLDSSLTKINTHETARRLQETSEEARILVCYLAADPFEVQQMIQAGVAGFVAKNAEPVEYANAVRAVAGGGNYFSNSLIGKLFSGRSSTVNGVNLYNLTHRETEVLRLLADGMSNKEVARRLELSVRTVETHRLNIRRKTKAYGLSDLVRVARKLGLKAGEDETADSAEDTGDGYGLAVFLSGRTGISKDEKDPHHLHDTCCRRDARHPWRPRLGTGRHHRQAGGNRGAGRRLGARHSRRSR